MTQRLAQDAPDVTDTSKAIQEAEHTDLLGVVWLSRIGDSSRCIWQLASWCLALLVPLLFVTVSYAAPVVDIGAPQSFYVGTDTDVSISVDYTCPQGLSYTDTSFTLYYANGGGPVSVGRFVTCGNYSPPSYLNGHWTMHKMCTVSPIAPQRGYVVHIYADAVDRCQSIGADGPVLVPIR